MINDPVTLPEPVNQDMPPDGPPRAAGAFGAWLVAGAATVVAMALAGYAVLLGDRVSRLERRLVDTSAQIGLSRTQVADARRALAEAESSMSVLLAPDVARVDAMGQGPGRDATARVYWSGAHGAVLVVDGLPAPRPGTVYQVWLVTPQAAVSAGFLAPDTGGHASMRLAVPPVPAAPVTLAVTSEPEGGAQKPTGDAYISARVS